MKLISTCTLDRAQRWFEKFQNGDFDVRNEERGRPAKKSEDAEVLALLNEDDGQTCAQEHLAEQLNVDQSSVSHRLKAMGRIIKVDIWVPHELMDRQQENRKIEELLTSTPKHSSHPELLRQLALNVINDIPDQALIIYIDGSRSDMGRAGSDICSKINIRNPDHCSVFRLELIAISGALDHALNSYKDSIRILTDSRSSIQYLKNWPKIMDSTGLDILSKLVRLCQRKQVCLQWIPSHVGVPGNEAADELAVRDVIFLTPIPLS
ncbi:mariner Mos1 transposase [Trichonephila clavipes]|nr:mariner Mos1 transposase [Trichonephila clavipes]